MIHTHSFKRCSVLWVCLVSDKFFFFVVLFPLLSVLLSAQQLARIFHALWKMFGLWKNGSWRPAILPVSFFCFNFSLWRNSFQVYMYIKWGFLKMTFHYIFWKNIKSGILMFYLPFLLGQWGSWVHSTLEKNIWRAIKLYSLCFL